MDDDAKFAIVIIVIAIAVVAAIIILSSIVKFLIAYPFIPGLLIGLAVGIGGTLAGIKIKHWFETHKIVEVEKNKK